MSNEFPVSKEWRAIPEMLIDEQQTPVMNEASKLQREAHRQKQAAMTEEEKQKDQELWDNLVKNRNPHEFIGNMGHPETLEEFKNRYGRYPWGYDENGNKMDKA